MADAQELGKDPFSLRQLLKEYPAFWFIIPAVVFHLVSGAVAVTAFVLVLILASFIPLPLWVWRTSFWLGTASILAIVIAGVVFFFRPGGGFGLWTRRYLPFFLTLTVGTAIYGVLSYPTPLSYRAIVFLLPGLGFVYIDHRLRADLSRWRQQKTDPEDGGDSGVAAGPK